MTRRLRSWGSRAVGMFTRSRRQREFDEELQAHLDMHVDDNIRAGMTPEQARREALLALGGTVSVREAYRDRLGLPSLDALVQDVRFGWRMVRRTPGISAFAVLAIALGIGINTTVFSLANAVLYKRLPVHDPGSLVFIGTLNPDRNDVDGVSWPDLRDLRARLRSVSSLAAAASTRADLSEEGGYAEALHGEQVTENAFSVMGVRTLVGRTFLASDSRPGAPAVAILSKRVWTRRYGGDPGVVGRTARLNGVPTTIVGVVDDAPLINEGLAGVWTPFVPTAQWESRQWNRLLVFGRLAPGYSSDAAAAEVRAAGDALANERPDAKRNAPFVARDFRSFSLPARVRLLFLVMLGAVGFVLLVACANVANLLLARAAGRTREVAIRTAIGATRRRIVRQLLIESLMLSALGGAIGLALTVWGVQIFDRALVDADRPLWLDFSVDVRVLAYLTAITVATAILFGLAPAWRLARSNMLAAMKDGTPGSGHVSSRRIMATLVVAEMTLAVILLAGAGVMIRSFLNIYQVPLGFERPGLHTFRLNTAQYLESAAERERVLRDLLARLEAMPGVTAASVTSQLPTANRSTDLPVEFADPHGPIAETSVVGVLGPYDRAVGAPVGDGRFLSAPEWTGLPAAVVNATFAARAWPGQRAVGKQFRLIDRRKPQPWLTVVGVMPDIAQRELEVHRAFVYVPYALLPQTDIGVVVRSETAASLYRDLPRAVASVHPDLAVIDLDTFDHRFYVEHWPARVFGGLFTAFGGIALLLAALGLYGVTSYSTSQRQHEIGVRVALGATRRHVLSQIASGSIRQVAIALVLGLAGAAALTRLLSAQLVDVSPHDPTTFAGVVIVLSLTAVAGCVVPVRRALRVNPLEVLRHE